MAATSLPAEVAADDERGPGRIEARARRRAGAASASRRCDRLARSAGRPVVRRRPGRRSCRRTPPRPGAAGRPGLEQVVEPLVAKPVDLVGRERRVEQDLGEQARAPASSRSAGTSTPTLSRVPAGLGVERGAEALGGLGQPDRVVALGALGQGAGGEDRRAAGVGRLVGRTGRQHERGATRAVGPGRSTIEDAQAVRRAVARLTARELVRPWRAGLRAARRRRAVAVGRRGGHAATSSSLGGLVGLARAASSAGAVSGR